MTTLPESVRVNAQFPFPATVTGLWPVTVAKQNGIWTVSLVPEVARQGPAGPAGPAGPQGPMGPAGTGTIYNNEISVTSFGFIGDGFSHPLSSLYGNLAAAQAVYPFVDDLNVEVDWAALQAAIDFAYNENKGRRTILIPDGANGMMSLPIYLDPPNNIRGGATAWAPSSTYFVNDTVNSSGVVYISIISSNHNNTPASSPSAWRPLKYNASVQYKQGDYATYNGVPWVAQIVLGSVAGGSGYANGTYANVPLTGGTGTGAVALTIVVSGGAVTSVAIDHHNQGSGYLIGDSLSASNVNLGGSGSGFAVAVVANQGHTPTLAALGSPLIFWKSARNQLNAPLSYGYSLIGAPGLPASYRPGCLLQARTTIGGVFQAWNCAPLLIIGTGNGNLVSDIYFACTDSGTNNNPALAFAYEDGQDVDGTGIIVSGGAAGASRTLIERVGIAGFHNLVQTGGDQPALADSNTFRNCWFVGGGIGLNFLQTQNFANVVHACVFQLCKTSLQSVVGCPVLVSGGNFSAQSGANAAFNWSSVSALTHVQTEPPIYTFTAVVASPDTFFAAGMYDALTMITTNFGIVPFQMTRFNPATNVATFTLYAGWVDGYFHSADVGDIAANTALSTDIQAVTKFYASQMLYTFRGGGIHANNIHIENYTGNTCLIDSTAQFGGSHPNYLTHVNGDNVDYTYESSGSTDAQTAQKLAAQVWPFIRIQNVDTTIEHSPVSFTGVISKLLIEFLGDASTEFRLIMNNNTAPGFNLRVATTHGTPTSSFQNATLGAGECDENQWATTVSTPIEDGILWSADILSRGRHPVWGYRPVPYISPIVLPSHATTLNGALPAITNNAGAGLGITFTIGYPLLWGGHQYKVADYFISSQAHYGIMSLHHYYSYGQNLSATNVPNFSLRYKGQSCAVYCNDELLRLVFPGLGVVINDGSSDIRYMVTGVFPKFGYFTVVTDPGVLSGSKTTVINPTVLKQDAYTIVNLN